VVDNSGYKAKIQMILMRGNAPCLGGIYPILPRGRERGKLIVDSVALFSDTWLWLILLIIGLVMVILELIVGVETGLDMVFIGSAFILGALITFWAESWILTVAVTSGVCIAYVAIGRRYVHRFTQVSKTKTNIDAVIGQRGVVLQAIARNSDGLVRVGQEQWRARSDEDMAEGDDIIVTEVRGVTLIVKKEEGGE